MCDGKPPKNIEAGRRCSGVEGLPETGCPLDPEPGLGGMFSLGSLQGKASPFLGRDLLPVTAITALLEGARGGVDLGFCP